MLQEENIEVVNNTSKVETKIIAKTDQPKFISPRAKKLAKKKNL